jgi:UDP-GlcNAc:undecaprenyl-phosphate GlcNAc-1-phosphate transferase
MRLVLPFILAMVVTMAWLPVLARLSGKWLFVDHPGERKVHTIPIPRVGGLAMACGVFVAALLTIELQAQDRWFLVSAAVLIIFGAIDDRFDLDYRIKLVGQGLAIAIVVAFGDVQIHAITLEDKITLPTWIALPLTVMFLLGVTNAINLADGLDGLAGGTTFLCLCAVALLSSIGDPGASAPLALAFAGAVLGFLRFNTYPASVFMGDAGSQVLGFTIAVLSVRATQNPGTQVSAALPVLLLALPVLDTLSVMVQRIGEGRSPFSADKNHIHHKLLAIGFDHHEAVMAIYVIQAGLFVAAYFLRFESDLVILGVVTSFFLAAIILLQVAARTNWRLHSENHQMRKAALPRFVDLLQKPNFLPRYSYVTIALALTLYAGLVIAETSSLASDMRVLIVALLVVIAGFLLIMRDKPMGLVDKAVLYVTATVLVYLDAIVLPWGPLMSTLCWVAVAVAAVATAIRLRLLNDRRFQFTPLDLIVLFMALVVPNLPGSLGIPHGGALAVAKLVVLFYAIEMLLSSATSRVVWLRVAAASVLAGLTLHAFVAF